VVTLAGLLGLPVTVVPDTGHGLGSGYVAPRVGQMAGADDFVLILAAPRTSRALALVVYSDVLRFKFIALNRRRLNRYRV
jgi:hypothetical protein